MNQIRHCCRVFIIFLILSLFFALPGLAQTTKSKKAVGKTQPQSLKLNPDNLEQASYRIWLAWYQARKAGQQPPTPVLDMPNGIDAQEVKRVQAVWQQSQVKAHMAMVEKDIYQIWLAWYEQGQNLPTPDLKLPEGINEQEAKQVQAMWQRAQLKAQKNSKPQKSEQTDNSNGELAQQPLSQPPSSNNQFNNLSSNQQPQGSSNLGRMSASMKPPANSTLTAANTANLNLIHQYDNAGNTTIIGSKSFGYNVDNQITDMTDANTGISAHMVYDVDGNLVRKTVGPKDNFGNFISAASVTNSYLVDTNNVSGVSQVMEETATINGVSSLTHVNNYGLDGVISQRQWINNQWVLSFFHKDGHSSVRALTDINGNITDTFDYDAYGNLINRTGTTSNYYMYVSERWDPDLSLYYNRARYLNVDTGRFLTMDKEEGDTEEPISLHKYIYAHSNPINKLDPTGKFAVYDAIGNNFRTAFAGAATFGRINDSKNFVFSQSNPFPPLEGMHLELTKEALYNSLIVTATKPSCDQALKDYGTPSLFANAATVFNENKIYDGSKSTAFYEIDKKIISDVLDFHGSSVDFAITPTLSSDLREKFSPPIIFVGKYFFTDFNTEKTADLQFRTVVLLHESVHYFGYRPHTKYNGRRMLNRLITTPCFPGYQNDLLFK